MTSRIRVRFASLVLLLTEVYAFLIAIAFSLLVVRKLSQFEYGVFNTVLNVFVLLWSVPSVWMWWISRITVFKGLEKASTGLALNILYLPIMILLFFVLAQIYGSNVGIDLKYFTIFIPLAILNTLHFYLMPLVSVHRPEHLSVYRIVFETLRLLLALLFVLVLHIGVEGVVAAMTFALAVALVVWCAVSIKRIGIPLTFSLDRDVVKKVFVNSYVPLLNTLTGMLQGMDRAVASIVSGDVTIAAYLGLALIPRNIVVRAIRSFSSPLYAKALRESRIEDLLDVLLLCTAIALLPISIFLAVPRMFVDLFNPVYRGAEILLMIAVIDAYLFMLVSMFNTYILGSVRVDLEDMSVKRIVGSYLFKIPLANFIRALTTVLTYSTAIYILRGSAPINLATLIVVVDMVYLTLYLAYIAPIALKRITSSDSIGYRIYVHDLVVLIIAATVCYTATSSLSHLIVYTLPRFYEVLKCILALSIPTTVLYLVIVLMFTKRLKYLVRIAISRTMRFAESKMVLDKKGF